MKLAATQNPPRGQARMLLLIHSSTTFTRTPKNPARSGPIPAAESSVNARGEL